ncbi:hypothetical protein BU17DRAFT_38655, partial [Hysterangium stoloniferum]
VVFVHGLDGHPIDSWTAANGICWPRDLLPTLIPRARVLSYGYDARTRGPRSTLAEQLLEDYAIDLIVRLAMHRLRTETTERPIIFVVHSMGGIILKAALINASMAKRDHLFSHKQIHISTYGIVYLGTPHQGMEIATMATHLLNVASIVTPTNTKLLRHLEANHETLQRLQTQYNSISTDFVTKYAYEVLSTHLLTGIDIVPRTSAVVSGAVDAETIGIHADHIDISKFPSANNDGYQMISGSLKYMTDNAPAAIQSKWLEYKRRNM